MDPVEQDNTLPAQDADNAEEPAEEADTTIDIEKLADKVYRLMLNELRLARARGTYLPREGKR
jgi:hypothetical protein